MASQEESSMATRPKEEQNAGAAGGEPPSKNALRKAAKEKEKAEKAAKRQQQEQAEREKANANDTAKHLYGQMSYNDPLPPVTSLREVEGAQEGQEVTVKAQVHNARVQSAKLAFLVLREQFHTIQVVIAEGGDHGISRPMVKWSGGINTESTVRVTGVIKKPKEEVKSTSISHFELHVESIYIISEAAAILPIQVKDVMKPPPSSEEESEVDNQGNPNASLKVRLDNPCLAMRAPPNLAINMLQGQIYELFCEFMRNEDFTAVQSPCLVGAATEGGAGVFSIKYFERTAYLTQSPQFFKQWCISGGMKRVYAVGPVFRAENSNTKRHLTEVRCPFSKIRSPALTGLHSSLVSTTRWKSTTTTTRSSPSENAS